jgi:hypothetical protein
MKELNNGEPPMVLPAVIGAHGNYDKIDLIVAEIEAGFLKIKGHGAA